MVKNQRNSCCHMGCPPMFVNLHFHRGYSLGPQKSKPLIIYGIVSQWVLRSPIIWRRENCLPEHVRDRPSRSYEYVFMFAKDRHYFFNKKPLIDKKIDEDMWTIAARPKNGVDT